MNITRKRICTFFGLVLSATVASAEEPRVTPTPNICDGFTAHAKSGGVPIYRSPDSTAEVVRKLNSEEEVCCIGRQAEFVILHLEEKTKAPAGVQKRSTGADEENEEPSTLGFVKETDLWLPQRPVVEAQGNISTFEKLKRYVRYVQSGGVPEDGLLPYRWLIGPSVPEVEIPTVKPTPVPTAK